VKLNPDWEKLYLTDYQTRFWGEHNTERKYFIPPRGAQTPIRDIVPISNDAILGTHWNCCTFVWRVFENGGIGAPSPKGINAKVYCSAITPHKPCLIQGLSDGTIAFMSTKPPFEHAAFYLLRTKAKSIFRLTISSDERYLLATDNDEHVFMYKLDLSFLEDSQITPTELKRIKPVDEVHDIKAKEPVQWLSFTPNGKSFASGSRQSRKLVLWDTHSGKKQYEKTLQDPLGGIAVMPNGDYLVADSESKITFWELHTMSQLDSIEYKGGLSSCSGIALSPNGRYLVTPSYTLLILWDLKTGEYIAEFEMKPSHDDFGMESKYNSPREPVETMAFLPDGKHLVSGGDMGGLNLWDLSEFIK